MDRLVGLDGVGVDFAVVQTPDGQGRLKLMKFRTPAATTAEPNAPATPWAFVASCFALEDMPNLHCSEVALPARTDPRPTDALQEVIATDNYDQVRDVLGAGYHVAHHSERETDGQGISVASRWPITARHEVDLHLATRPAGFACSALICEIQAPQPIGQLVLVNHLPDWQLTHEAEREQQTVAVARFIEHLVGDKPDHVVVAGDMDATPDAASIRFWTGKQSLDRVSVCYRDAWSSCHPGEPGLTFTPENTLMPTAEIGDWELELGRRVDYLLVRCSDHGPTLHAASCRRLFDQPVGGVWASDHFGVTADLSITTPSGRPVP